MKKTFPKFVVVILSVFWMGLFLANSTENVFAGGASISIAPSSKFFQLTTGSTYDEVLKVKNNGDESVNFEVYTAPYAYSYSEELQSYVLGFNQENEHTKIAHWISIMDQDGNFTSRPTFTAEPGETVSVKYRITIPNTIPDGGQYAVLFAHTLSSSTGGGIKSEASPGMVIYGRSNKGLIVSPEISDLSISQPAEKGITASAKIKNTGNVDFDATSVLKVTGLLGITHYETPEKKSHNFVIPGAELEATDTWEGVPIFGLYNITWTVTVGDKSETTEMTIFILEPSAIIIGIILLTLLVVCIIVIIKKRRAPLY